MNMKKKEMINNIKEKDVKDKWRSRKKENSN